MAGRNRAVSPLSNDSYVSNYSDDFEDDDTHGNTRYKTRSPVLRTAQSDKDTKEMDTKEKSPPPRATSETINRSNRSNRGGRGRGGRFGRGSQTGRSSQEPKFDNIAKRVMSARRLKINELKNANEELYQQIRDLKDENKLLKKTQLRTEKALQRFEDKESDLPQIMQRQQNEVRSLKDQIRKWREKYEKTDRYLRDAEDELEKVKFKLKKLKSVAEEKELPERSELNKRLTQSELDIEERDIKIKDLEKHLQNIQKNHRHELGIERARQKDSNKKMMDLREENEKLEIVVKEKEKELQMKNIYANRMVKPPHRLPNSYNGTPTPPVKQRRPSLSDGITPRERAKLMEERRREDLRKQREMKEALEDTHQRQKRSQRRYKNSGSISDSVLPRQLSVETSPRTDNNYLSPKNKQAEIEYQSPRNKQAEIEYQSPKNKQAETEYQSPRSKQLENEYQSPISKQLEQQQKEKREKELRKKEEEEARVRERLEAEERERQAWEEKERLMDEEAQREEEERRNREDRERLKKEAEERERKERIKREREEQDRREREWKEKQERERREREEKDRRERERLEQERRAREERERMENDEELQAERKKKELILQKLREIDEGGQKDKKDKKTEHFFVTSPRENSMDSQASKKSYTFSQPTENLHKGKPSHNEANFLVGSPTRRRKDYSNRADIDGIEKGGYNPSFTSNKGAPKSTKNLSLFDDDKSTTTSKTTANKSRLMEDLFGSKNESSGSKQNVIFDSGQSKKTGKSSTRSGFPWDDESSKSKDGTKRENSSTVFAGGNAFINDEEFQTGSRSTNLRRPKQTTTTFHNRPTVTAVDHLVDDDIEEVIL